MKLKDAPVGTIIGPTSEWERFRMPGGNDPIPHRLEVVEHKGDAVICRPVGGGPEVPFYRELECTR